MIKPLLLATTVCAALLATACRQSSLPLKVMTFNIRLDVASDSLNRWSYRKDVAAEQIREQDPDVVGLQEVLHHQLQDLKDRLPDYASVGVGRADGREQGEYSPLLYKADKLTLLQSGTFWLSPTPDVPGSKGWDAACERVATWAILQGKKGSKQFFVVNTHLDHMGQQARLEGARLILTRTQQLAPGLPVIMMGDLNDTPESAVLALLLDSHQLADTQMVAAAIMGADYTFHGFGAVPIDERPRIDYILVGGPIAVLHYQVLPETIHEQYVSDHAAVVASLKIK